MAFLADAWFAARVEYDPTSFSGIHLRLRDHFQVQDAPWNAGGLLDAACISCRTNTVKTSGLSSEWPLCASAWATSYSDAKTISRPKRIKRNQKNKVWSEDNEATCPCVSVCGCKFLHPVPFSEFEWFCNVLYVDICGLQMIDDDWHKKSCSMWLSRGFRRPTDPRAYGLPGLLRHRQCCLDDKAALTADSRCVGTLGMLRPQSTLCLETWHILTW